MKHTRNSTLYKLYVNGSPEGPLSNGYSGIAELIFGVEILNFEKIDFLTKIYKNSQEDWWPFGNI